MTDREAVMDENSRHIFYPQITQIFADEGSNK